MSAPFVKPGDRVLIERRLKDRDPETWRAVVRSVEQRDGFEYVGWSNPQDDWQPMAGAWGFLRQYDEPKPFGSRIVKVLVSAECKHPTITQEMIERGVAATYLYGDSSLSSWKCPDCRSWVFPERDEDDQRWLLVDEPRGAGR